jgi:hypothetical protein
LKQKDIENIFQLGLVAYAYDSITWGGDAKDHEFDASLNLSQEKKMTRRGRKVIFRE